MGIRIGLIFCWLRLFATPAMAQQVPGELRIIAGGDIMIHQAQLRAATIVEQQRYEFGPSFYPLQKILHGADLAMANLELTLPEAPPYSGYPFFRSPKDLAIALKKAGFNVLFTANNHANDHRQSGLESTIHILRKYGFYQTGTFIDTLERADLYPLIIYRNGFKIALLNYTFSTNGIPTAPPNVVNLMDEECIARDFEEARAYGPDVIIVCLHWGTEYQTQPNLHQRRLAEKLVRWGADLILGAHPHVVQPVELDTVWQNGTPHRIVPVAYSLGNLISGMQHRPADIGLLLDVTFRKDAQGATRLVRMNYKPIYNLIRRKSANGRGHRIVPCADVNGEVAHSNLTRTELEHVQHRCGELNERLRQSGVAKFVLSSPTDRR